MYRKSNAFLFLAVGLCLFAPAAGFGLDFSVGAKAGIEHNGYFGSDHQDYLDAMSFNNALFPKITAGAFAVAAFGDLLALQPELLINSRGGSMVNPATPDDNWLKENFAYLSIPVLVRLSISVWKGQFLVFAGPGLKIFLAGGTQEGVSAGTPFTGSYSRSEINTFVISSVVGVGYQLPLPVGALVFDLRSDIGLSYVFDQDAGSDNHQFWTLGVLVGYVYEL